MRPPTKRADAFQIWIGLPGSIATAATAISTAVGLVFYYWKYIQLAADLDGFWVYPITIAIILLASGMLGLAVWWLWPRIFGHQVRTEDSANQHSSALPVTISYASSGGRKEDQSLVAIITATSNIADVSAIVRYAIPVFYFSGPVPGEWHWSTHKRLQSRERLLTGEQIDIPIFSRARISNNPDDLRLIFGDERRSDKLTSEGGNKVLIEIRIASGDSDVTFRQLLNFRTTKDGHYVDRLDAHAWIADRGARLASV